jgi:hypothetical protein
MAPAPGASGLALVCRPTPIVRFMHGSELALKTTAVSHGTACERGSIFTPDPLSGNPPKRYLIANVQKNYVPILLVVRKSGNGRFATRLSIPWPKNSGPFAVNW